MFGDWRPSVVWPTALSVGLVLALGVWLHPLPPGARRAPVAPETVLLVPTPVERPRATPSGASPSPTASPPARTAVATIAAATASPVPGNPSPASLAAAATVASISDLPAGAATPTPPVDLAEVLPRKAGVPILMYHYIRVNPNPKDRAGFILSVTPADFAQQMALLDANGFHTVTMAQVRDYVLHGTPLPPKPIALTFDDGYDDAYSAARPVLEQHHQTATFFIISGFVDRARYLTWSQVEALDRQGMEIGSHTVHHPDLAILGLSSLRFELDTSRSDLEAHIGHPVLDFCYPGGEFSPTVVREVARTGYLSATTTRSGVAVRGDNPLELPRLRVWGGMTPRQFAAVVGQPVVSRR
ncbi:MAG: polysaccharide deacetylase family protein [Chloroflexota bacterium]